MPQEPLVVPFKTIKSSIIPDKCRTFLAPLFLRVYNQELLQVFSKHNLRQHTFFETPNMAIILVKYFISRILNLDNRMPDWTGAKQNTTQTKKQQENITSFHNMPKTFILCQVSPKIYVIYSIF